MKRSISFYLCKTELRLAQRYRYCQLTEADVQKTADTAAFIMVIVEAPCSQQKSFCYHSKV